ncbi:hypothetical protein [Candidatus Villigracilis saccharophilus]|uniref:hypothetical protein n=1 Tax=Candidatus Villigracilis saccharophilus TaxID=3140684 RepID=UPI003136A582|nr:hypothetical protein [Anaerolineales bacterium]
MLHKILKAAGTTPSAKHLASRSSPPSNVTRRTFAVRSSANRSSRPWTSNVSQASQAATSSTANYCCINFSSCVPRLKWSGFRTPISGYYLAGSGAHPGGGIMGSPGKFAAELALKDGI